MEGEAQETPHPQPHPTKKRRTNSDHVPNIHLSREARIKGGDSGDHRVVLHVGAVPDLDAVAVAADDGAVPDGDLVPQLDLTHDRGGGGDEGIAGDARALVEEVGDLAVS